MIIRVTDNGEDEPIDLLTPKLQTELARFGIAFESIETETDTADYVYWLGLESLKPTREEMRQIVEEGEADEYTKGSTEVEE